MHKVEPDRYHYSECGLDNIYLISGFDFVSTPRGKSVRITNVEGLHRAIGLMIVKEKNKLTGKEFRFLRHELNQTQSDLAAILGVGVQSVARWEKGRTKEIEGSAQRLLRAIYRQYVEGVQDIVKPLKELARLDEISHDIEDEEFGFQPKNGWQLSLSTEA
jgi:putative transcriptional regulator